MSRPITLRQQLDIALIELEGLELAYAAVIKQCERHQAELDKVAAGTMWDVVVEKRAGGGGMVGPSLYTAAKVRLELAQAKRERALKARAVFNG